jgi:hypothetical protein
LRLTNFIMVSVTLGPFDEKFRRVGPVHGADWLGFYAAFFVVGVCAGIIWFLFKRASEVREQNAQLGRVFILGATVLSALMLWLVWSNFSLIFSTVEGVVAVAALIAGVAFGFVIVFRGVVLLARAWPLAVLAVILILAYHFQIKSGRGFWIAAITIILIVFCLFLADVLTALRRKDSSPAD